jgi:uncharacterized protein YndB with AHSA1/START domain
MASVVQVTVTINQPAEKAWEVLMDPGSLQHWMTGFISLTPLTGKPGEAGSISSLKFLEHGKEMEVMETVLLVKPNEQYRFRMVHRAFEAETDIRLVSFGNRTELIQTVQLLQKGFLMKLLLPFHKRTNEEING